MLTVSTYNNHVNSVNIEYAIMKYHHGNLKEELISSACIVCEADGHSQMSLRSIAKEAKVSQTAPYRHFQTKECLLAEVSSRGYIELKDILSHATSDKKLSAEKRFLEMGLAYIKFGLDKRNTYDLMHNQTPDKNEFPKLLKNATGAFDILVQTVMELNPELTEKAIQRKCIKHWAMIHGLVGLLRNSNLGKTPAEGASKAMASVRADLKSFLDESLDY